MPNERITENIVRDLLKSLGYYKDGNCVIEEQSSAMPRIQKLLKTASKSGNGVGQARIFIAELIAEILLWK